MRWLRLVVAASIVIAALSGCRRRPVDEGPWMVTTLANLHPDARRHRMYSLNYQLDGLIPVCTPMRIDRVSERNAIIVDLNTNQRYEYIFDRHMRETVQQHLDLYFGGQCPQSFIQNLSPIDQQGIREGRVYPGMTKQGVVIAIGYPPSHETPTLDQDVWKYWRSRWSTFTVNFANGVVANVTE